MAAREVSEPTDDYIPCPYAADLHKELLIACRVMRGPKVFHIECGVCRTRVIVAPKILKATDKDKSYGFPLAAVVQRGWIPQP